jgi:hypothetical protein
MRPFLKSIIGNVFVALAAFGLLLSTSSAIAQTSSGAPHGKTTAIQAKKPDGTWDGLSPTQQKILAPLESDWDYMLPDSRKKWIYVSNIYPKMSAQDQERLQSRMASWSNLSQKDRRIARENYLASLKFPAEKKAEAWSAYQKLSDEQKKKLAEMETKKKPKLINAPTLQQHTIKQDTTPPPPALKPRAVIPAEETAAPAGTESQ